MNTRGEEEGVGGGGWGGGGGCHPAYNACTLTREHSTE